MEKGRGETGAGYVSCAAVAPQETSIQDMSLSECIDALLRAAESLGFLQHQLSCARASVQREIELGLGAVKLFRAEVKRKEAEVDKAKHRKHWLLCRLRELLPELCDR